MRESITNLDRAYDVLTPETINHIHKNGGWLTQYQRQQVVNFIDGILEIELDNYSDFLLQR